MSRLLFWLRRFRLSAQGWRLQRLVRMCLIAPSISFAEVCVSSPSPTPAEGSAEEDYLAWLCSWNLLRHGLTVGKSVVRWARWISCRHLQSIASAGQGYADCGCACADHSIRAEPGDADSH